MRTTVLAGMARGSVSRRGGGWCSRLDAGVQAALRHTYATLALRLGTHPGLLSERLGHTSISVSIDRYSHVIPSIDRNAADVVAQLILPRPG